MKKATISASASAPASLALPPGLRVYFYLTAAVAGAAVMIVEILGAKMLAPFFGTSHFVWTAQIAVTLCALAAGYYAGGWLADRSPDLGRLYACLLGAALYLAGTLLLVEPLSLWCLRFQLAAGSLLASGLLFFVPLCLLATTGPFLIRVLTVSVNRVGGNVGRLSALSTLGSFAGTLLIGYVLVPFCRNSVTMLVTALALGATAAGYFFLAKPGPGTRPTVVVTLLFAAGVGWVGTRADGAARIDGATELFRGNSNFGQLQVVELGQSHYRYYLNDLLTQNGYDPATRQSTSMFTYMLHSLGRGYATQTDRVLCIGLGVGIVPRLFLQEGAQVDVVEINPAVIPVARDYFDCPVDRLNVTVGDGRWFLHQTPHAYDVIVLDAFLGDSSPAHLMSRESFAAIRGRLAPDGVLVMNCFGDFDSARDFFVASLDKTLHAVFRSVRIHAAGNGNIFLVASDQVPLQMRRAPDLAQVHPSCRYAVGQALAQTTAPNPDHGQVLTDDYNPVDYFDAANRERFRRSLVSSLRGAS